MNNKTLIITRDSVAAGDDVDAPHEMLLEFDENEKVEKIIKTILKSNYLPKIYGGKATWCIIAHKPLAIIAQEWFNPKVINTTDYLKSAKEFDKLHFKYHVQENPEIVFEEYFARNNNST
jgi:hypothetical protein